MPGSAHPGSGHDNQGQPHDVGSEQATRNAKVSDAGPMASRGPNAGSRPDFEQPGAEAPESDPREQRSFQAPAGAGTDDPREDRYDPSAVEATRERSQGLGMGERDLERQRDPHRPAAPPDEDSRPDGE